MENSSADPAAFNLVTKASTKPVPQPMPQMGWKAFAVGKSVESVHPVTCALPELSTAMLSPSSSRLPPR